MKRTKKALKRYTVWFEQINYTMLEVSAADEEDAEHKAINLWKKEYGVPAISQIRCNSGDPTCIHCGGGGVVQGFPKDQNCSCVMKGK